MIEGDIQARRAGLLLHLSSLPGPGETGDMGSEARHFVDFLQVSGMSVWQMLPIGPTQFDGSPYQSSSMHAGNPRFISLEPLVEEGWLPAEALAPDSISDAEKRRLLLRAWREFQRSADPGRHDELRAFVERQPWLPEYALFRALHEEQGSCWWEWPKPLRDRDPDTLRRVRERLTQAIGYIQFEQHLFFRQWQALKAYANERGVWLFGDMPIFVAHDSAEVWTHRDMFMLDAAGHPEMVAGVPPDYFSATGQRWGNPLYRWEAMEADGFSFWEERMRTQLQLFDLVRIDHFRGFESFWAIPAEDDNAINGHWMSAPGDALFERLHQIYDPLPLVAEDLGIITPEVEALRLKYGLPGMKILQFAFSGESSNPYLPFRHERNSVVYTGTHDNDTTRGWYLSLDDGQRRYVDEYLGRSREVMPWPLIRAALASRSRLAILPMQDVLGLDSSGRMNLPGTTEGNWRWRFDWAQVEEDLALRLYQRVEMYGRLAPR
ncbi:MAG TPA: 4-alpha-glucanotransferase [Sedimenticola thiotaurini]|uniref:4-alpha-glucanotransferase n=1 Tax=Sedimenticola thiotaurini TaxID=1543721 RepID=A0A831WB52_9GAMM|nr:4-alpha-glucanotransferase [Sedimenticola thiotaurini]